MQISILSLKSTACLVAFVSLLSGCSNTADIKEESEPSISKVVILDDNCAVIKSEKWHAWLDKYHENEGKNRLLVSGIITLPNPSYTIEWSSGPTDRMRPPTLRLRLTVDEVSNGSIQVISKVPVKFTMPTSLNQYRKVLVFCGDELLAEIPDVQMTD